MRSVPGENDRLISSVPDLILIITDVTNQQIKHPTLLWLHPVRTDQSGLHESLTPDGVFPPVSGHLPTHLSSSGTIFCTGVDATV